MLGTIAKQLRVRTRNSEIAWRYGYHALHVLQRRFRPPTDLSGEALRVVQELNQNGVARTSVDSLLKSRAPFTDLRLEVDELLRTRAAELEKVRRQGFLAGQKTYSYEFFPGMVAQSEIHRRFVTQPEFRQVAEAYLGMRARLRGANTWLTLVTNEEARQSQTWHRDPEDRYVVKLFALLSDVDDDCGPFHYARGSHMKTTNERVRRCTQYGLSDDEMDTLVPRARWFKGTGAPGTLIFADTRGYHKGGLARGRERLLFVGMYLAY